MAAPGWYDAPGRPGQTRWWNGSGWTEEYSTPPALPVQPAEPAAAPKHGFGCLGHLAIWTVAAAVVIGGSWLIGTWTSPNTDSVAVATQEPAAPAAPVEPVKSAAQKQDEAMVASGFKIGESGNIYYMAGESGSFTCGSLDCIYYSVIAVNGCPGGVYFAASIEDDAGVSYGQANKITAGLATNQQAAVLLEDYTRSGSKFRPTEVRCLG